MKQTSYETSMFVNPKSQSNLVLKIHLNYQLGFQLKNAKTSEIEPPSSASTQESYFNTARNSMTNRNASKSDNIPDNPSCHTNRTEKVQEHVDISVLRRPFTISIGSDIEERVSWNCTETHGPHDSRSLYSRTWGSTIIRRFPPPNLPNTRNALCATCHINKTAIGSYNI